MARTQQWIGEDSGWIIELTDGDYINISFQNPLVGTSYIKMPEELRNLRKVLINVQNEDMSVFIH